ncbi:MAG: NFACT RNA binding domain-containing protein [Bacteroidota bacterium]
MLLPSDTTCSSALWRRALRLSRCQGPLWRIRASLLAGGLSKCLQTPHSKALKALSAFAKTHQSLLATGVPKLADRKHPFLEFHHLGYTILVGKNARQNDRLTFQFSKKTDIWMHARDAHGSHVIVRNPSGRDLPTPVLEYAAALAAHHSKRKSEQLVPVQYAPRKFIRKVKNGAPGKVIVEREKVVMVEPREK